MNCDFDDSVDELSQALQGSGTGGGGQNHPDVAGETLQEQLPEEGFVESSSVRCIVSTAVWVSCPPAPLPGTAAGVVSALRRLSS